MVTAEEFERFRDEIRLLIDGMPISICKMTDWQLKTCTLFLLYDICKTLKHVDKKLTTLQKKTGG